VIVNHTRKEYFYPDVCKWGEVLLNPFVMYGILDYIREHGKCTIEITDEYHLDELREKNYKEIEIDWREIQLEYSEW